jgi:hypothetical protein
MVTGEYGRSPCEDRDYSPEDRSADSRFNPVHRLALLASIRRSVY